jgi:hypothetical protein
LDGSTKFVRKAFYQKTFARKLGGSFACPHAHFKGRHLPDGNLPGRYYLRLHLPGLPGKYLPGKYLPDKCLPGKSIFEQMASGQMSFGLMFT